MEINEQEIASKIEMMTSIASSFNTIISQENDALKAGDIKKVKHLYEQKIKTVATYRTLSSYFIKNRESVSQYQSPAKEELKELSKILDDNLKLNAMLLKTQMDASKVVMNTFINIAKRCNASNATSYGARGAYTPLDNKRNALAYNCTM